MTRGGTRLACRLHAPAGTKGTGGGRTMKHHRAVWRGVAAAMALGLAGAASAQVTELKIMAPAAPGGGWDQTARSMQQALTQSGLVKSVQVTNVPGAGGSIGIVQLVNNSKGDGNQLMVMGYVMVGALLTNKSPVTLDQTTPIARLTT